MVKVLCGSMVGVTFMAGVAVAGVDVRVNVGTPLPTAVVVEQRPVVVEKEKVVVVKEKKDNGKHKGWKKHKNKKHDRD